ncbi:multiple sugar transport system ATP-binding protein [Kribbella aluminosa]|uniref:Multiple sugar transport system ATP-binding protein n=1 Tax=Kribbella aluminosa TaxID=416017 RepID=A0ABS4UJL4_9ACTN|nr:ABC transporter ATP-binding protein [Kribbella aluminosa]MBP2351820.1 multiple sugar transport system ATP-binding protein [Kribbella aluminosa]
MTGIRLDAVSKVYGGRHLAVDNVSLDVPAGEVMVLLGPSGCGKTTLLRMIAGLEELTGGDLWLGGSCATDLSPKDRGVAMVFQNGALYPNRTARENIMFPLRMAGEDVAEARTKAAGLAKILGIDKTLDRLPGTLSGGQRQRVAIGRAIVRQPRIFLMDEPLSNLDATMRTELRQEIGAMVRDLNVTTVYVTHDQIEALTLADRIAVMRDGRIEDVGTPTQVFNNPATAFTAGFLGAPRINLMSATIQVTAHHRVSLDLGAQTISLPPTDRRSMILSRHDGVHVIVGARSDAFTPTVERGDSDQLLGTLRTLEFHGNQWIAFVDCGVEMLNPDLVGPRTRPPHDVTQTRHAAPRRSTLTSLARLLLRRPPATESADSTATPTHRRADLVIEVDPNPALETGTKVHLGVDPAKLHIFDQYGHRVDRVTR